MSVDISEQYDKVFRYCCYKTNNRHLAEDITQETFLRYFSQTTYISRGKPLAYLYTIAKNLCVDYYRKKQCETLDENEAIYEMKDLEQNIVVRQAVEQLPGDLQELIILHFVNELSISEISSVMSVSRFTLYRKVNRAMKRLKELLQEEDFS